MDAFGIDGGSNHRNPVLSGHLRRYQGGEPTSINHKAITIPPDPAFYFQSAGMGDTHRHRVISTAFCAFEDRLSVLASDSEINPLIMAINDGIVPLQDV